MLQQVADVFTLKNCCLVSKGLAGDVAAVVGKTVMPRIRHIIEQRPTFRRRIDRRGEQRRMLQGILVNRLDLAWSIGAVLERRMHALKRLEILPSEYALGDTFFEDIDAPFRPEDSRECKDAAQARWAKRCKLVRLLSEHHNWKSLVASTTTPEYELPASNNKTAESALRAVLGIAVTRTSTQ